MLNVNNTKSRYGERGNVLFLILIAVALFAALSYAVTQSTRSGGGSGDNETSLISSAQLTQYPASVRTSVVRMIIGGVDVGNLEFNPPSGTNGFATLTTTAVGVFHPQGGGSTYANAPGEMMASGGAGTWIFNGENQIELIGTTNPGGTPTAATSDIIAFLPGITLTLCNRVNKELGLPATPPTETGVDFVTDMVDGVGIGGGGDTIGEDIVALDGEPFGCFNQGGTYVYYHVLVER